MYRHALAVTDDGKMLAMGSTTGGLWLSETAGAKWKCLSAHLPPVYAVRFGVAKVARPRKVASPRARKA